MGLPLRKSKVVPPPACPLTECMLLLRGAWAPNVIWYLRAGPRRFGELRHDIPRSDLVHAVTGGAVVPQPVVDLLYEYRNEKRTADIVSFPAAGTDIGQTASVQILAMQVTYSF